MSLDTNGMSAADVAAVVGNNRNNDGFFGGDGAYLLLFFLFMMCGGWNNGGMWGNGMWGMNGGWWNMEAAPYFYNMQTQNEVARGFDQSATTNALNGITNSITTGFAGVNQGLCNSTASITQPVNNGFANAEIAANGRQIANMQQAFNAQTAVTAGMNSLAQGLQNCCCENRAGIADLKYTVATENCADRAALADGLRDVIANQTANTQRILDQLCNDKIDAKNDEISALRQQLAMKDLAASQTAQNAFISQGFANEVDQLYNRLSNCPVPTTPVYGRTPIFTCNNGGCGCGNGFAN